MRMKPFLQHTFRQFCWNFLVRKLHENCVKSALVRRFPHSIRIRENTDQKKLRIWTHSMKWKQNDFGDLQVSSRRDCRKNFASNMSQIQGS